LWERLSASIVAAGTPLPKEMMPTYLKDIIQKIFDEPQQASMRPYSPRARGAHHKQ
jgi:hypothetical protein